MHRCQVCERLSFPREPRLTFAIQRTVQNPYSGKSRQEIAKELTVCYKCRQSLRDGAAVQQLRFAMGTKTRDHAAPEYKQGPPKSKPVPRLMSVPDGWGGTVNVPADPDVVGTAKPKRKTKKQRKLERLAAMEGKFNGK